MLSIALPARASGQLNHFATPGDLEGDGAQHASGKPAKLRAIFPKRSRQVHKYHTADSTAAQGFEQVLRLRVRHFANQKVQGFSQKGLQVISRTDIAAMSNPPGPMFYEKAIRLKGCFRIPPAELSPQGCQVSASKGGDPGVGKLHRPPRAQGSKGGFECQELGKNTAGIKHVPQGFDALSGQEHFEIPGSLFQPETLHQHEESPHVITVHVGNENPIDVVKPDIRLLQAVTDRIPAVNQEGLPGKSVEKRRMLPNGARPAISDADTSD
jgi:hypothetical protein